MRGRARLADSAARWTSAFLQPPHEAGAELLVAMSKDRQLAEEYFDNLNRPEKQWERADSPEGIRACIAQTADPFGAAAGGES